MVILEAWLLITGLFFGLLSFVCTKKFLSMYIDSPQKTLMHILALFFGVIAVAVIGLAYINIALSLPSVRDNRPAETNPSATPITFSPNDYK